MPTSQANQLLQKPGLVVTRGLVPMDFAVHLHEGGPWIGLPKYEENLFECVSKKGRTSVVAKVLMFDRHGSAGHLCRSQINSQMFHLRTDIDPTTTSVTILNGTVSYHMGPFITIDEHSALLQFRTRDASNLMELVETCTGIGGNGLGASYAGWQVKVRKELMPTFCQYLRATSEVPIVEGSICNLVTVAQLHQHAPTAGSMACFFRVSLFQRQATTNREWMREQPLFHMAFMQGTCFRKIS